MTDTQLLGQVQRLLLEPDDGGQSWASGLWTRDQVLAFLHDAQVTFVRRTGILRGWVELEYGAHETVDLPEGILQVLHADTLQGGLWRPCPPGTRIEADQYHGLISQTTWGIPRMCLVEQSGTRRLQFAPVPATSGRLYLLVVPMPQIPTGQGDPLSVGAMWAPFILAGVVARMLTVPGVVYQPVRAARYAAFFNLGVQLALQRVQPA